MTYSIEILLLTYIYPKLTYSGTKVTYSYLKVTCSGHKVTYSGPPNVTNALWAWMVVFSKSVVLTLRR